VISADVRRAAWDAAAASVAAGELPGPIAADGGAADTSTLRPGRPGEYVSTLPYLLAAPAIPPHQVASLLAARLAGLPWIATATAAAGHLTITVTSDALASVAVRTATAPDCARSDILRGMTLPAPPPADLAAAPSWQQAHADLAAEVTARLAAKAGAEILPERLPLGRSRGSAGAAPTAAAPEMAEAVTRLSAGAGAEILPERLPPGHSRGSAGAAAPESPPPGRSRGNAAALLEPPWPDASAGARAPGRWRGRSPTRGAMRSGTRWSGGHAAGVTAREWKCPFGIISTIPFMLFGTRTRTQLPPFARPRISGLARGRLWSSHRACSPIPPSERCSARCRGCPNGWPGRRAAGGLVSSRDIPRSWPGRTWTAGRPARRSRSAGAARRGTSPGPGPGCGW
jgi:hypothetical protein